MLLKKTDDLKSKTKQTGPAIIPVQKDTRRGAKGVHGGAWDRVAQPRRWMETDRDMSGMYPFIAGTNRPRRGAPIGYDMTTGTAVAMDHLSLYSAKAITAPAAMLFGLNGYGKSSLSLLVAGSLNATGTPLAIFDPIKGEYVQYAEEAGAKVFQLGPTGGRSKINPMDPGPLTAAGQMIGGEVGESMINDGVKKVVSNVVALIRINRGMEKVLDDSEETMIKLAVEHVMATEKMPSLGALMAFFDHPSERAIQAAGLHTGEEEKFKTIYLSLYRSIASLVYGELSEIFSETGMSIDPGNPAGFCFDSSAIPTGDSKMISATMMSTWRLGMDAIDAHWELAQHELRLAAEAAAAGDHYTPKTVWRGYSSLMDEFWFPIRMAQGMINEADHLSRTNRSKGVGEWKVTHSPKDFAMLSTESERNIAKDLMKRCGLWVMMAMSDDDLAALSEVRPLTHVEMSRVSSFTAGSQGLENASNYKTASGLAPTADHSAPPAGAGKALWKVGESMGIPVKSPKPATLKSTHITDARFFEKK
ncbi:ATP-binding protein [Rothia sp. AR01]|uniref:ATP-binding protein n=1 Tax=Rothia santali TaxID=2949643 RepID=A0A9X2HBI0_9MICC|nr:ATP-binding protein [Rothia santali]MCP3425175.1 ATP-binding protein [Rothia santali]